MSITTTENTATISSSEYSLVFNAPISSSLSTTAGVYQVFVDLSGLDSSTTYQITVYEKVIAGGSTSAPVLIERLIFSNDWVWASPPLALVNGWDVTLQKVIGNNASISWSIRKVG